MKLPRGKIRLYIAVLLWSSVFITESWAGLDENACMMNLLGHGATNATISSSSNAESTTAESVFTSGWCANVSQQGDKWIDVYFPIPMGIRGVALRAPTSHGLETNFPTRIDFLYVPVGQSVLQPYTTGHGSLAFSLSEAYQITTNRFTGIATRRIQFLLRSWSGKPCFQLQILGCPVAELCPAGCSGRGQCLFEENCLCDGLSTGPQCQYSACNPVPLGMTDGRITGDMITASSSASGFSKDRVSFNGSQTGGWCPEDKDQSPWLQVKLPKPMLVSVFAFNYIPGGGMFMRTFKLKFKPATGSQQQLLDFGEEIPALNGTHFFDVRLDPPVVTDTIKIIPITWETRACFRLDLRGCDPVSLCQQGWCQNGGSCMGQDTCLCPNGFLGSRCETTANNVPVHAFEFTRIEHNVLITTSYTFEVHGTVTIHLVENTNVIYLNGQNSFVSVNKNQTSGCMADVDMCSSGFTYGLDLQFEQIAGLIPILSNGGDLPNGNGLSLFYTPGDGFTFIVSTTTEVWTLHVKYNLTVYTWHRYEISWNKLLGVSLYVDGHLLGSATKPAQRQQPATVTRELCLGCSYTSTNTIVHMMVRDFKSWSFSRGDLVQANAIPTDPATTLIPTTTTPTTTTVTTTDSSSSKTTSTTTQAPIATKLPASSTSIRASTAANITSYTGVSACNPIPLGLTDGMITGEMISASSSASGFSKNNVAINGSQTGGWCPEDRDQSPWLQVKLPKPMLVSVFRFNYIPGGGMFMRTFKLKFRPATSSQQQLLDFGEEIPALNGTHFFDIRLDPPVVTDTIKIIPSTWKTRACFRLDLRGCDPVSLCLQGWCQNGGSCMGQNTCLCPNGFLGSRCETTANNVPVHAFEFTRIEHNVLITTSYTFEVHGTVTIDLVGSTNAIYLNGQNSFVTLNKNQTSGCMADVDMCSSGFTYGLDLQFKQIAGFIPILSSGGDLPNGNGLSLFYTPGDGFTFIVSTTTEVWTLHVKYNVIVNTWHRYEISWNKLLGVSLYIDGHLLGSATKPAQRQQPATVTRELCLGCSYTSTNTSVHMMVRDFKSWSFSRGDLVQASAIPTEPTTTPIPTTIHLPTTTTVTTTDSSSSKTTSTTTQGSTRHPLTPIEGYNMTFIGIKGNILITPTFNLSVHGTPTLELNNNGSTALVLNGSGQYVELPDMGIPCLQDMKNCTNGFTFNLEVNFLQINTTQQTYIFSSWGNVENTSGMALYLSQGNLICAVKMNGSHWMSDISIHFSTGHWYTFQVSWAPFKGCAVLLDRYRLNMTMQVIPTAVTFVTHPVYIGSSHNVTYTAFMKVRNLYTWTANRETLISNGTIKAPTTTPIPTTIPLPTTSTVTTTDSSSRKTTSTTTQGSTRHPLTPIEGYNMTFIGIKGNILITPTFNLSVHGTPTLELNNNGSSALVLNGSGQYVELPDMGIPCLQDMKNCTNGFTFNLEVNFLQINTTQQTYIFSSWGNVENTSGMALYLSQGNLICAVKMNGSHWMSDISIHFSTGHWYTFQVSWAPFKGCSVLLDSYSMNMTMQVIPTAVTFVTHPVYIGSSHNVTYTAFMKVRNLYTWTANRETLISNGTIKEPTTTPIPTTIPLPTTTTVTTTDSSSRETTSTTTQDEELKTTQSTVSSTTTWKTTETTTAIPTSTSTSPKTNPTILISTTTTTKTTESTAPSTTELRISEYHWNFTNIVSHHIIGSQYNLTVNGTETFLDGGLHLNSTSQFIDFGTTGVQCLLKPHSCFNGVTIQFTLKFYRLEENTYLFSSGAENLDGIGIAILYRFGQLHFVLSTSTHTWFTSCSRNIVIVNGFHTYMMTWYEATGLFVYVDNQEMCHTTTPVEHHNYTISSTNVYFGKPATSSVTTTTILSYIIQTVTIWYVRLEILIQKGICKPPITVTTTEKPSTVAPTTRTTKLTPVTMTQQEISTAPSGQCPVGCVPAGQPIACTKKETYVSTVPTSNTSPSKTPQQTTPEPTTPKPTTPITTTQPTTTNRGIPPYETIPTLTPGINNGGNAYLSCNFNSAIVAGLELVVSLWIDNKQVDTQTVPGTNTHAIFYVAQINENLYNKQIKCSVAARYVGSSINTILFYSNVFKPTIAIVSGSTLVVVEGHWLEYIIVTSTAPPQFFCCKECKAECIVHVVGHFTGNNNRQCNQKPITDAVILSTSNTLMCGSAVTTVSWNQPIKIPMKATIDNTIDRDQRREIQVEAHVYNQPQSAAITVTPHVFPVGTVTVTSKDNDHRPSTCSSMNDPHMTTFDALRYDNFNEGEFVLYRHSTLPFEVRAEYRRCGTSSRATCNCAVAIKSGDDVITFRGCQNSQHHQTPMMSVQIYKNNELTPGTYVKRMGCGQKYEVGLPTGTVISVQNSFQSFINVWIMGSATDWGNTTGLCGIFDGKQGNDLTDSGGQANRYEPHPNRFSISWKETYTIFYGVGPSSQSVTANYCSCVQGRESLCTLGLGMIECDRSRDDITDYLVRQAKPPMIKPRAKRQANTDSDSSPTVTPTIDNITSDFNISNDDARTYCEHEILNNSITKDCRSLIGNNLTAQVDNCIHDYMETGNKLWARDALRDIIDQCLTRVKDMVAESHNSGNNSNSTTPTPLSFNLTQLLDKACLEDCGQHGHCANGVCQCYDGYSGLLCNVSSATQPTLIPIPQDGQPCDKHYEDCKAVNVAGDNFVQSKKLTCHFEYTKMPYEDVKTGEKGIVAAVFISLNSVLCPLPEARSALVQISNNGINITADKYRHVVYDSVCFECHIGNTSTSDSCERKDNNCIIGRDCYSPDARNPINECQLCKPRFNTSAWTDSRDGSCILSKAIAPSSGMSDKTLVTILAVVCAVLGVLLLITIFCICKIRGKGKKTDKGNYSVNEEQLHRDNFLTKQYDNPIYVHPNLDVSQEGIPNI